MSEPDSTPRRQPPVIDLTAEEVKPERENPERHSSPQQSEKDRADAKGAAPRPDRFAAGLSSMRSARSYAIGAAIGAVAAAAIAAGIWYAGIVPAQTTTAPPREHEGAPTADGVSSRLDKIEKTLQAQQATQKLAERIAAAEAQQKLFAEAMTELNRRLDTIAKTAENALTEGKNAAAAAADALRRAQAAATAADNALTQSKKAAAAAQQAAKANPSAVDRSAVEAIEKRVAALETAVKSLSADVARLNTGADDGTARASIAAAALSAAVERGTPYAPELAAAKALGADPQATAPLDAFAADGVPTAAALGRELTALVPALQRALQPPAAQGGSEASVWSRLESHAQKLVRVTRLDAPGAAGTAPANDDAASLIARIKTAAAENNIAEGLSLIRKLPEAARTAAAGWVKKAEARASAIAASRQILAAALAKLGGTARQ
jgi:hypothetical protein